MKYYYTLCLLLVLTTVKAQEYRSDLYQAYLLDRMDNWKAVMDQMEKDYSSTSDPVLLYDLLEAEYGYMGWLVEGLGWMPWLVLPWSWVAVPHHVW